MFSLVFKKQAAKYYEKSPKHIKQRLNLVYDKLTEGSLSLLDIKPLKGGFSGLFRIRMGDLRIFIKFSSRDSIDILHVSPRGDAY